jgi:hypothetical protein
MDDEDKIAVIFFKIKIRLKPDGITGREWFNEYMKVAK